jgi:hypothetical protein
MVRAAGVALAIATASYLQRAWRTSGGKTLRGSEKKNLEASKSIATGR